MRPIPGSSIRGQKTAGSANQAITQPAENTPSGGFEILRGVASLRNRRLLMPAPPGSEMTAQQLRKGSSSPDKCPPTRKIIEARSFHARHSGAAKGLPSYYIGSVVGQRRPAQEAGVPIRTSTKDHP